jgi:ketosteroid isomerase-like protein
MDRFEDDVRAFVALVAAGRSVEAIDRFYADDVELYENYAAPRVGKAFNRSWEQRNLASLAEPPRVVARAVTWNAAERVSMVEWEIRFVPKGRSPMRVEEVAVQRWRDGRIVSERFFYEKFVEE